MSDYLCSHNCYYRTSSGYCGSTGGWITCQKRIKYTPDGWATCQKQIEYAPIVYGQWENINDLECFKCSHCGKYTNQPWGTNGVILYPYCPNCGAKMGADDGNLY